MLNFVTGLTSVAGPCLEAYFCPPGSSSSNQIVCTEGYFCGPATQDPAPCPNGTFSDRQGLAVVSECRLCTPGYFCGGYALINVTGPCKEGM